ncbi:SH3-like domain-containing protein [Burkholderia pseudomallei]|uniref:SH3-like domain-containing protein n=1 Tax=Burkholderia pseudomallei TaxID=28450 RepID=UPI0008FF60DE|nr:SH3-like domain-containing protein [Burkholderia pseudomallei]APD37681.1 nitrile hydratase [Burkholderia pseudomallei]ARK44568.1 nitrile hydratase [Burkholderia pseudomallei]ARK72627.1 nitrile hydratase [Burkholderia pseudomallei]ARK90174.1 nitrile hydratase [Burkholderia pseudomallei]ARL12930.1 nitrile hydratase [Burkholderia pseudomallei]
MDLSKITRLPNDIGGNDAGPIRVTDHELLPWEKRCHALLDILDVNKIINTEEKRRGVEDLGKDLISQNGYYERWIMSAANILMQKQLIAPDEIARKTSEVEARLKQ